MAVCLTAEQKTSAPLRSTRSGFETFHLQNDTLNTESNCLTAKATTKSLII